MAGSSSRGFFVVGVGAAAGSEEALGRFFSSIADDVGAAFVVVSSGRIDAARIRTLLPVAVVDQPTAVQPNHVYVARVGERVTLRDGVLYVGALDSDGAAELPIDHLFRSLAADVGERAVGVVLTPITSDGASGLSAIAGATGLVMAQYAGTAPARPLEALVAKQIELAPHEADLAQRLLTHLRRGSIAARKLDSVRSIVPRVCSILRQRLGNDFSQYKELLVVRRVERRMGLHHLEEAEQYLGLLTACPLECEALFRDLLIGVTRFFRDVDAWSALALTLCELIASRPEGHVIRAWVAGCATGEEAYSLAMILKESLESSGRHMAVEILATDLDDEGIRVARAGEYPEGIASDVGTARLGRFFAPTGRGYRISQDIREMVVFAFHDMLKDPPPSPVDVVLCRNVLIYLETEAQRRLLPLLHGVLRRDGLLVLGPSEAVGDFSDRFAVLDRKWRILRRAERPSAAARRAGSRASAHGKPGVLPLAYAADRRFTSKEDARASGRDLGFIESTVVNQAGLDGVGVVEELE
jgi:two-component system CheB/CheR fusion protein